MQYYSASPAILLILDLPLDKKHQCIHSALLCNKYHIGHAYHTWEVGIHICYHTLSLSPHQSSPKMALFANAGKTNEAE